MTSLERLGKGKYVLVTTYRRDGRAVPTPVWVVRDGDHLAVWTATESGKVKRIRNNPRVDLTECDFRGNPKGESVPATARVLDATATERVRKLIRGKYGITGTLTVLGSKLRRGADGTTGVELTLD